MDPKDRIIAALDVSGFEEAQTLVEQLAPYVGGFKIGLELQTSIFVRLVAADHLEVARRELSQWRKLFRAYRRKIFWDGKWNDIPATMAGAAKALRPLAPRFFNVHAAAGQRAIAEAMAWKGSSLVLGVTVLTSLDETECFSIFGDKPGKKVLDFARMLVRAGVYGVICSPQELKLLKDEGLLEHLVAVTPGVRPSWAASGDQRRVMTPAEAIQYGATYLVIGRPITQPPKEVGSPRDAVLKIIAEIEQGGQ